MQRKILLNGKRVKDNYFRRKDEESKKWIFNYVDGKVREI